MAPDVHVKVVAVLYLALGAVFVVAAGLSSVAFGVLARLAGASGEPGAPVGQALLGLTAATLAVVLVGLGAPAMLCGWGLLRLRAWARIVGIVLAAIMVIQFPIGTVFGAYVLWVLFRKQTEALFGGPPSGA